MNVAFADYSDRIINIVELFTTFNKVGLNKQLSMQWNI